MKSLRSNNRTRKVTIRLSESEYAAVQRGVRSTTNRQVSSYARALLLQKPVTTYTRNQSLDEAVRVLVELKKELAAIANNFNQVVRKLNAMSLTPELVFLGEKAVQQQRALLAHSIQIQSLLDQITSQWLHG